MKEKIIVVFGIDDFNPGVLVLGGKEFSSLQNLFASFPKLKATGFCAANYSYAQNKYMRFFIKKTSNFLKLATEKNRLSKNTAWIKKIKQVKNISLELHGLTHFNAGLGTAEEFKGKGKKETDDKMQNTLFEFEKANIKANVFAPPGWALNKYVYSFCKEKGIIMANSFYDLKSKKFSGETLKSPWKTTYLNGVKCVPRNIDIKKGTIAEVKDIVKHKGIISFHSHVKNIGVENGLTKDNIKNLGLLLEFIENNYSPQYKFFKEL
jgi:hypothetical protein